MKIPIIDTHCDLLSYLTVIPEARADKTEDIACAIPFLKEGNVKMQVLAIYTNVVDNSMDLATAQALQYKKMLKEFSNEVSALDLHLLSDLENQSKISLITAIENAAGLANEVVSIEKAFEQLEKLISLTGKMAYISLTHHTENRFGGGNYTEGIGLKDDGKRLLDYISGRKIAIDLSHTSDLLAVGILDHIDRANLDLPVNASHSNFRAVWDHKRNLTDEIVQEIIRRKGIIGVNFLRAFLDNDIPERIFEHILYGIEAGAGDHLCFGADFFYTQNFPDKTRFPFYFPLVENAGKYPSVLEILAESLSIGQLEKLAYKNAQQFFFNLCKPQS
jgi:microsomal dipeptidase-like Zn-dependent dipeptidase